MQEDTDSLASLASLLAAVARTPRVPPVLPGTEVAGRYLVMGVLGAGGMGVVYRARDRQLQRDVAIKLCSRVAEDDRNRLLGEALALARLSHEHVITVYEVGRHGDDIFVVMELVPGSTLRAWLTQARHGWREIVRVYLDAAAGLHAVHRAGLVHGDFKPENVLLGADGRVRLVDFGLARMDQDAGGSGGTPRYMAPEVRDGWFAGQRSDQYSYCVALGEALAEHGHRPRAVLRALARGTAEDAERRHESMAHLRRELVAQLERRRRFTALVLLLPAVAILGLAGGWVADRAEQRRTRALARQREALEQQVEQGRRELLAGNVEAALVYLASALQGGLDRPAVRYLLARGLGAVEQDVVRLAHEERAPVTAAAFLPRGPQAVIGDADGSIGIYDTYGVPLREWRAQSARVLSIAVDESGTRLISCDSAGQARLRELRPDAPAVRLAGTGARWRPDGRAVTWGRDGTVRLWTPAGKELARLQHGGAVTAVALSGGLVASASLDGTARLWDGKSERILRHPQTVLAVDLDAGRVVTGSSDGVARVWDLRGAPLAELRHPEAVTEVRLLAGDRVLTACDDGNLRLWEGGSASVLAGHTGPITALVTTPDQGRAISGSSDGTVRVWDLSTGRQIGALAGLSQGVRTLALAAPLGLMLVGGDDGSARLWQISSAGFIGSLGRGGPGELRQRAAWFAGRSDVVAVDEEGAVNVYNERAGSWSARGQRLKLGTSGARQAAVDAAGVRFATVNGEWVDVWDLETGTFLQTVHAGPGVTGVELSAGGETLAAWSDSELQVWAVDGGALLLARTGAPTAVALSPRGDRMAVSEAGGDLLLWDLRDGLRERVLPRPAAPAVALRFDPSGTLLGLGGGDADVQVWDVVSLGQVQRRLGRHGSPVVAIRFAPDSALVYSLGADRRVRVWDLASATELGVLTVDAFGGMDVSSDGSLLLVHQGLGRVSFWDVSREPRTAAAVKRLVGCLVPLRLDEDGHLVAKKLEPCQ